MPSAPKLPPLKPRHTPPPRGTTTGRGYGHAHEQLRTRLIRQFPLCQHCGQDWSTDLHHLDGNPFNRDPANCLMLCERCHHAVFHGRR